MKKIDQSISAFFLPLNKKIKRGIYRLQGIGLQHISDYETKKQLLSFNGLVLSILLFFIPNMFVLLEREYYFLLADNTFCFLVLLFCLYLTHKNKLEIAKHVMLITTCIYIFFFCLGCGSQIGFEYYYGLYVVFISLIFTRKKMLFLYYMVALCLFFSTRFFYSKITPLEFVNSNDYSAHNMSNTFILLTLIAIVSGVFRSQNSRFLKEISDQKKIIEEHHKEITDSINYAERIQRSFLATKENLGANLKEYFIFFCPKDIVSGDFYFSANLANNNFILATADSTGHGVPGAIMSLLNSMSLEKAVEQGITQPSKILDYTRKEIINRLKKDGSSDGGKDGMDCSLCVYDFSKMKLFVACANNPVWIVRNTEVIEIKPDKMPVGKSHNNHHAPFIQHEVDLQKGDVIYTFTDGYADQFGGPKEKKFKYKQLEEVLLFCSKKTMPEQKQVLESIFHAWKGMLEQVDDVLIIGVRV